MACGGEEGGRERASGQGRGREEGRERGEKWEPVMNTRLAQEQ